MAAASVSFAPSVPFKFAEAEVRDCARVIVLQLCLVGLFLPQSIAVSRLKNRKICMRNLRPSSVRKNSLTYRLSSFNFFLWLIYLTFQLLGIQEEYIKDEMRNLKRELIRAKEVCLRCVFFVCDNVYTLCHISGIEKNSVCSSHHRSVQ